VTSQFFGRGSRRSGATIDLPRGYRSRVRWVPRIGDTMPDFTAESTAGPIRFHRWAKGEWVYLFSHPAAFTPVCTTELAELAARAEDFADRGVRPLNLSRDPVEAQRAWAEDIAALYGVVPDFPMVSDPNGTITEACGMIHPQENASLTIRKAMIIDPALNIRMIFEYPMSVGRSVDEILRVIDALQATDAEGLAAPGGWHPGEPLLVRTETCDLTARERFGARLRPMRPYLRFVEP
jgi:thioredoxin-dependent peroxiredoxin